ncbi:MAG: DUF5686 family protein, partial [Bacteroidales bacterium]
SLSGYYLEIEECTSSKYILITPRQTVTRSFFLLLVLSSAWLSLNAREPIAVELDSIGEIINTDKITSQLLDSIIANRKSNRVEMSSSYQVDRYERLSLGWLNLSEKEKNRLLLRHLKDLFRYTDTSDVTGESIDYLLTREKLEEVTTSPGEQSRINVRAINHDWVDKLISEQGIKLLTDESFYGFSIYDSEIRLLLQSVPGPLTNISKSLYNYRLLDRVVVVGEDSCSIVEFAPTNNLSLGFKGRLYVARDGSYAIRRANMELQGHRNINFLDRLFVKQDYVKDDNGRWLLIRDDVSFEIAILKLALRRVHTYSNYQFDQISTKEFNNKPILTYAKDVWTHGEEFWVDHRIEPLTDRERAVKEEISRKIVGAESSPWVWIAGSIIEDEFDFGKWNISPLFSIVTFNEIEGCRLRVGGSTTNKLHPKLFLDGYAAYGLKDEKWKYFTQLSYCFNDDKRHPNDYPIHSLSLSIKDDVAFPGSDLVSENKDNLFYSFRRYPIEQMLRVRSMRMAFHREYRTGFSYEFWANSRQEFPLGTLTFELPNTSSESTILSSLRATELGLRLRFAPDERFYQRRYGRFYTTKNNPVLTLSHRTGIKDLLGGDYSYNITDFSVYQRIRASGFGYFDLLLKAGKQWDEVPFPYLVTPQANPSYLYVNETFDLMGVSEFITDQYLSWQLDYHMGGLIFNTLPFNRYLKLREVVGFKGFAGSLSDKNDPRENSKQMLFPKQPNGDPMAYSMRGMPYMEASIGIDNILRFIRIDYVWRLSYREHPGVDRHGLRIGMNLQF